MNKILSKPAHRPNPSSPTDPGATRQRPVGRAVAHLTLSLSFLTALATSGPAQPAPRFLNLQSSATQAPFLSVVGAAGQNYDLQYSSDLVNWTGWVTLSGADSEPSLLGPGSALFLKTDTGSAAASRRYYRAIQLTGTSVVPGDHLVTGVGESPESVTADASGNIYMSILPLSKIKKITPQGVATDFATIPGPGATVGIKTDAAGNVYIVKRGDPAHVGIWKVSPTGAPALYSSIPDSKGLNDLVFDNQGNLYVTDSFLGAIYKVDPSGKATVWKSDPALQPYTPPVPFPLNPGPGANGIAFSQAKSLFYIINTTMGGMVQVPINADGTAGTASVLVQDNSLVGGDGINLDSSGNILVANNAYSRILRVTPQGSVSKLAEGGLINISSSLTFVPGGDPNSLYLCNFAFKALGGDPAWAGLLKLDLTTRNVTPVAYLDQDIVFSPIHHATFVIKWGPKTIYSDPVGGGALFQSYPAPDLILITHIHGDHLDTNTLSAVVGPSTVIIAPQSVFAAMPNSLQRLTTVMANGTATTVSGAMIEAIPAYNITPGRLANHPKGRDNGYVLTLGGRRVYISSDTEDIPEMRALTNIDVAFLCMNPPFTMDVNQAASATRAFRPKVVYPFHFNGALYDAQGTPDLTRRVSQDVELFKQLVETDAGVEVRLRSWYQKFQIADRITSNTGDVVIYPIHHASVMVGWKGRSIYNDPWMVGSNSWQGYPKADLILVGHIHADHYDTNSLYALKGTNTVIIAPQSVFNAMPPDLQAITIALTNAGPNALTNLSFSSLAAATVAAFSVQAVPAYNLTPERLNRHPRSRGDNGYVLTLGDKRIYFSGDTEDTPEMRALTHIDAAFVCMNLPFTMDANQAASAVRTFQPAVVYPYHYLVSPLPPALPPPPRVGTVEDVRTFRQLVGADLPVEVRLRHWWYVGFE